MCGPLHCVHRKLPIYKRVFSLSWVPPWPIAITAYGHIDYDGVGARRIVVTCWQTINRQTVYNAHIEKRDKNGVVLVNCGGNAAASDRQCTRSCKQYRHRMRRTAHTTHVGRGRARVDCELSVAQHELGCRVAAI
jgi:hypothetical protein